MRVNLNYIAGGWKIERQWWMKKLEDFFDDEDITKKIKIKLRFDYE